MANNPCLSPVYTVLKTVKTNKFTTPTSPADLIKKCIKNNNTKNLKPINKYPLYVESVTLKLDIMIKLFYVLFAKTGLTYGALMYQLMNIEKYN